MDEVRYIQEMSYVLVDLLDIAKKQAESADKGQCAATDIARNTSYIAERLVAVTGHLEVLANGVDRIAAALERAFPPEDKPTCAACARGDYEQAEGHTLGKGCLYGIPF